MLISTTLFKPDQTPRRLSALSYERRRALLSKDLTTTPCHPSNRLCKWEGATLCADRALDEGAKRKWEGATLCRGTQRQRTSLRECSAHIVAVAAATPQERAAAAVPALRRGANNERWCCCQLAATAASRLRAPMFQALPAFHVQCSSPLTPAGVVWSSLRRAAAGEGAEANDLQSGEVSGACRSGRRRWARGLQSGVVAMCSSARVGVGEGAEACSSTSFRRPGALLGSLVAFGSGCG